MENFPHFSAICAANFCGGAHEQFVECRKYKSLMVVLCAKWLRIYGRGWTAFWLRHTHKKWNYDLKIRFMRNEIVLRTKTVFAHWIKMIQFNPVATTICWDLKNIEWMKWNEYFIIRHCHLFCILMHECMIWYGIQSGNTFTLEILVKNGSMGFFFFHSIKWNSRQIYNENDSF